MRIIVLGAGGVGGFFGARYAQGGHEVLFVARGAHLAALRRDGLRIESSAVPLHLPRVHASDDPRDLPEPDAVLFCPKLWDVAQAAEQLAPALAPHTVVVPFQNGVESHELLARRLGPERAAAGVAHIGAVIAEPGVIGHTGSLARLRVGMPGRAAAPAALQALVSEGVAAGIDIALVDDIDAVLWEKFVFLAAMAGTTCLAREALGVVRREPALRATLQAAMAETFALARARGVALADDLVARQMGFADTLPAEMRSSMLNDLLAGRRLEAPWLCGAVWRMSEQAGLQAPVQRTLYAALEPHLGGRAA